MIIGIKKLFLYVKSNKLKPIIDSHMKHKKLLLTFLSTLLLFPLLAQEKTLPGDALVLKSPNGQLEMKFAVVSGVPEYTLTRSGAAVLLH